MVRACFQTRYAMPIGSGLANGRGNGRPALPKRLTKSRPSGLHSY